MLISLMPPSPVDITFSSFRRRRCLAIATILIFSADNDISPPRIDAPWRAPCRHAPFFIGCWPHDYLLFALLASIQLYVTTFSLQSASRASQASREDTYARHAHFAALSFDDDVTSRDDAIPRPGARTISL